MRLLHTSDWHLGQHFYEHQRDSEHQQFFDWLIKQLKEQAIDVLVISGDIYHTATPSANAEHQLYQFVKAAKQACPALHIVIIAGNHDSPRRITAASPLLAQFDTHMIGRFDSANPSACVVELQVKDEQCVVLALPFLRASDITEGGKAYPQAVGDAYSLLLENAPLTENTSLVVMGHLHARGASVSEDSERAIIIGGEDAVGADVFPSDADYVALGHLHKAQQVNKQAHIRYSGTPFPMSFSERNYKHQVVIVEFNNGELQSVNPLYIPRFREVVLFPEHELLDISVLCQQLKQFDFDAIPGAYLRLRISSTETSQDFREQIDKVLDGKPVRFCGIERVRQNNSQKSEIEFADLSQVGRLDVQNLLTVAFDNHPDLSQEQLTDELKTMFAQVVHDVEVEHNDED